MNSPFRTDPFRLVFRFSAVAALFYGAFIWCFLDSSSRGAFALYASAPPLAFALPLIVGGSAQLIGCCLYRRQIAVAGAGLCMSIFLAAEISCLLSQPNTTGVPAYFFISGIFFVLIWCAFRVPIPCSAEP